MRILICLLLIFCGCYPTITSDNLKVVQCTESSRSSEEMVTYTYFLRSKDGTGYYFLSNKKFEVGSFVEIAALKGENDVQDNSQ